ncbi:MAG: PLP-dependent aminotransferase family protein [Lachnospiraceae bacterium]|nr:PLP-dependent aminotransferase family protein [Lachnospiraceae bacterium]
MYDMAIELKADGKKCLYEQIYEHIREEIKRGKLLSGERLPSTRALAGYLQVSRNTVDFAYEQLLSEGYIEARPYKGYFVCSLEELPEGSGFGKETAADTGTGKRPDTQKEPAFDFSPNGLDMSVFPFGVWKRITKNILNDGNSELFALGEPQGDYDLRVTISRYLHSSRGVNCTPDQIVVGAGNDYLLLLLEKLLGRHAGIAMENPTYKRAFRIFKSFAYPIEIVGMDENGMLAKELYTKQVKAAYVMPSHQYPTGITMPIGRRMELLKWAAEEEGRFLIEDDYDSEFRYKGKPIPSLQGADTHGRVIYIGTFSKAIAPAIRVSFMVLPPQLLKRYREECFFYSSTVSRIDQRILNEFIRDGYFERYLNKTRKIYREKHDILLQELKPFGKKFDISGEHAGLHLLLTCRDKRIKEQELVKSAARHGVKAYALSDAFVETADGYAEENIMGKGCATVILGYGGMEKEQIKAGIEKLKQAWLQ